MCSRSLSAQTSTGTSILTAQNKCRFRDLFATLAAATPKHLTLVLSYAVEYSQSTENVAREVKALHRTRM